MLNKLVDLESIVLILVNFLLCKVKKVNMNYAENSDPKIMRFLRPNILLNIKIIGDPVLSFV